MLTSMLAYFGHHKCATTWTIAVLRSVCRDLGLRFDSVSRPKDFDHDLPAFTHARRTQFISWDSADARLLGGLAFERMRTWNYDDECIIEVRFEDLVANPYVAFVKILTRLGVVDDRDPGALRRLTDGVAAVLRAVELRLHLPFAPYPRPGRLTAERLLGILRIHDFTRKSGGRRRGEVDERSHYRKGTPGDWVNHLEPRHLEHLRSLQGDLVAALGYDDAQQCAAVVDP